VTCPAVRTPIPGPSARVSDPRQQQGRPHCPGPLFPRRILWAEALPEQLLRCPGEPGLKAREGGIRGVLDEADPGELEAAQGCPRDLDPEALRSQKAKARDEEG